MSSKKNTVLEIVREGTKIVLPSPDKASLEVVVKAIQDLQTQQETVRATNVSLAIHPLDGAYIVAQAIERTFGLVLPKRPNIVPVRVSTTETVNVHWGSYTLPIGDDTSSWLDMAVNPYSKEQFALSIYAKGKYDALVSEFVTLVHSLTRTSSLFRGRAFRITFGDSWPTLTPFDLSTAPLIYNRDTERDIDTKVFAPIRGWRDLAEMGIDAKRGILLNGAPGTGKTALMSHIAREVIAQNGTFVLMDDVSDLPQALRFAESYQPNAELGLGPVVIAGEDLDASDADASELQNVLDGVDTKGLQVFTIVTTNHPDKIARTLARPGRFAVIDVTAPDGDTVGRLIRSFGAAYVAATADLSEVGASLAGVAPDVIKHVVQDAKLASYARTGSKPEADSITADDLLVAARGYAASRRILERPATPRLLGDGERAAQVLVDGLQGPLAAMAIAMMPSDTDKAPRSQVIRQLAQPSNGASKALPGS